MKATPSTNRQASRSQLEFALSCLEEEHEILLALAIAVRRQVEPIDPVKPSDTVDTTAWRLAQVLESHLEKTAFVDQMRFLVLGEV